MLNASIKSLSTIHLAAPPPCRADHSRKNSRSLMKMNHEWTRIDTKTDGPPSTTSGTKMLLQFSALGVTSCPWWITPSIGFRQVPPPPCWADHSRKKLPIVFEDEPRMNTNRHEERWTSSGATTLRDESPPGARASRPPQSLSQSRPSPSPGSTGCRIAGKLSGNQRDRINRTRGRCTGG